MVYLLNVLLDNYAVIIILLLFVGLDEVKLSEDQYSLQHIKAFGLHNHLIADPWNPHIVFFVDANWCVQKVTVHMVS